MPLNKLPNTPLSVPSSFYIIRMTSKPPCVIIWLAFPGGTSGCIRNRVVIEVNNLISTLNIKQLQSWKDPTHHHNPCRHHQGESMSGTSRLEVPPFSRGTQCGNLKGYSAAPM